MRNIDKIIDEIPPPLTETELAAIANLITLRKTEPERSDLIIRCAAKFNIERSVIEQKVKETLLAT